MRRPAQHRLGPTASTAWAHPYTGPFALSVFYADGDPAQAPASPAPSPADLAAQAQKNPPAVEPIRDADGVIITQERFGQNMAKERRAGRHAAFRELAEAAGVDFDIDSFDPKKFGGMFKQADEARKAKLSEDERRTEALRQQEEDLATRAAQVDQEKAATATERRTLRREQALTRLGAFDSEETPNLQDALAMLERDLRENPDADATAVAEAAEKLKKRRPELFGTSTTDPGTVPPAPSGMPAPGMPRPGASQPKPGERGLAMLKRRGKIST